MINFRVCAEEVDSVFVNVMERVAVEDAVTRVVEVVDMSEAPGAGAFG